MSKNKNKNKNIMSKSGRILSEKIKNFCIALKKMSKSGRILSEKIKR
jgi:hypothetical protein